MAIRHGALVAVFVLAACSQGERIPRLEDSNVLLIVLDTTGAAAVGHLGDGSAITPAIDRLASEGISFSRAYTTAPLTQPAVASLLTGRMPHEHGVMRPLSILRPEERTLAERLRERGFETVAIVSHSLLRRELGFDQGFDVYDESLSGAGADGVTSEAVTDLALDWLAQRRAERRKARFFLMVHYFDAHYVYHHHPDHDLTSGYRGRLTPRMGIWQLRKLRPRLSPEDVGFLVGLYQEEVAHVDQQVGRLLNALTASGLDRETYVFLTADHGEEFMQHGWIGHTRTLYQELLHVPLVIRPPGGARDPRVVDVPVSILDVLPTLLALSRSPSAEGLPGLSLTPWLHGGAAMPERDALFAEISYREPGGPRHAEKLAFKTASIRGDQKLIHDLPSDRWELYDLQADPGERSDVFGVDPRSEELRALLERWEQQREVRSAASRDLPATGEDLESLRMLGYVE